MTDSSLKKKKKKKKKKENLTTSDNEIGETAYLAVHQLRNSISDPHVSDRDFRYVCRSILQQVPLKMNSSLYENMRTAIIHILQVHGQVDISFLYEKLKQMGFPKASHLVGIEKNALAMDVEEIRAVINENGGIAPMTNTIYTLQGMSQDGLIDLRGTAIRLLT